MRSTTQDIIAPAVSRALAKLGADLSIARRKRRLTVAMVAQRIGAAKSTYLKIERGDPTVSMGAYAMALFALGIPDAFAGMADEQCDDAGLMLDGARLPKRVRATKQPRHCDTLPRSLT